MYFFSVYFNPFPKVQFMTLRNWQSLQTTNFKFDENNGKFSKWVENTVGKGEIARYDSYCRHMQTRAYLGKG